MSAPAATAILCRHCEFWPAIVRCHHCGLYLCAGCAASDLVVCPECGEAWAQEGEA